MATAPSKMRYGNIESTPAVAVIEQPDFLSPGPAIPVSPHSPKISGTHSPSGALITLGPMIGGSTIMVAHVPSVFLPFGHSAGGALQTPLVLPNSQTSAGLSSHF